MLIIILEITLIDKPLKNILPRFFLGLCFNISNFTVLKMSHLIRFSQISRSMIWTNKLVFSNSSETLYLEHWSNVSESYLIAHWKC